jgi:demethylmenaquinone methyltransferase/2-methoxy-6-polyprenyl-1,4-benzoquinol methylase
MRGKCEATFDVVTGTREDTGSNYFLQTEEAIRIEVVDKPTLSENRCMSRANMDKNPQEVAAMFDGVAKRYDIVNDILSLGRTKAWRRAATKIIAPAPGMKILDMAAGTGSSSEPLAAAGADVTAADFSEGMIAAGKKARPHLTFIKADALNLPFKDNAFDLFTISFGLRNTQNTAKALQEARRVVKSGGRLVVVEFSSPVFRPFRAIYMNYLMRALPFIARKTSSNPDAYIYLADSIRAWPDQKALASQIVDAGWSQVGWKNLTGGVVAIHMAVAP